MNEEERRNAAHLLKLVHHLRRRRLRALLADQGVFPGQSPILFHLRREGEVSQRTLACALDQTPASMTVTLKRMEKAGLVVRNVDPSDKRVQKVSITEEGLRLCGIAREAEDLVVGELFKGFTDEQLGYLSEMLADCAENMALVTGKLQQGERLYKEYLRHVGPTPEEKGASDAPPPSNT